MDITSFKTNLLKSPMFNLSLSSKELFHSNFLAFLINNDKSIIKYLFDFNIQWSEKTKAIREKNKFDLMIYDDNNCIIIENKVKSIPNIEQLVKYQQKAEKNYKKLNKKFVLLSLYEPQELISSEVGCWNKINYSDIIKGLHKYNNTIDNNCYIHKIIEDYIGFMGNLIEIFNILDIKKNENIYVDKNLLEDLTEIKIHDLYYKIVFNHLKEIFKKKVEKEYGNRYNIIKDSEWKKSTHKDIVIDYNFTNGTGLFEFKVPLCVNDKNEKYLIGVQLQDKDLRLTIQSTNINRIESISNKLLNNNVWFDFSIVENICKTKNRQRQEYCSYKGKDDRMLYKYKQINDVNKSEIMKIFIKYLDYILENRDAFIELISV